MLSINFDLAVLDIDDAGFTSSEINTLKNQNKKIISYLSIGEAENYRDYWIEGNFFNNPPDFLDESNPDFPDNYKVKFWESEWQEIVLKRLDEIIDAGYDGVYLDIIDAYFFFEEKGRLTAKQEMKDFVKKISESAKLKNPNFLIIPQNSPELVIDEQYLNIIDGIGKEDTFYYDDKKIRKKIVNKDLFYLRKVIAANKFVLAIDYPTNLKKQCTFYKLAKKQGFIPFVSNRSLDKIEFLPCR